MNQHELKSIALFQVLDENALSRMTRALETRNYAEGELVFAEGDPGDAMYFLLNGSVRIEKRTGTASEPKTLAILSTGDYFGEMALLDGQPRSASAVTRGPTRTLRLTRAAFDALSEEGPQVVRSLLFAMIRTSGDRIRRLNAQVIVYDEIGRAIGEARNLQGLVDVILRQLGQATLADWGLVVLRAQFSDRLEVAGSLNVPLTAAQLEELSTGKGLLGVLSREPSERLVQDSREEEPFRSAATLGFESPALLLAPIHLGNQALGLIVLGGRQPGQFDPNDLNLARGVARQAAQAILNARHREEEQARVRHGRQFVRF